jgi:hypothetical protein
MGPDPTKFKIAVPHRLGPVTSLEQLRDVVARVQEMAGGRRLLFRGQGHLYSSIRSGRARPKAMPTKLEVEQSWISMAEQMLGRPLDPPYAGNLSKAILQHYGLPTYFVDLTSDPEIAAWFATHAYAERTSTWIGSSLRLVKEAAYSQRTDGVAYVLALAFEDADALMEAGHLFDLSVLPRELTRPHRQRGWLMLDRPPVLPTPTQHWFATIEIDCAAFPATRTIDDLFPPPAEDPGYSFLRSVPYVQIPSAYFDQGRDHPRSSNSKTAALIDRMCFGARALEIADYGAPGERSYDHKWQDTTLYEPHPMRMWRGWHFELEGRHEGISGDVANSIKMTVSPRARKLLEAADDSIPCEWPSLQCNDILFCYAELDHDKVIEHGPPYHGVWLHKDDELILESPMSSDEDELAVHAGHAYLLQPGGINRKVIPGHCPCDDVASHDNRVKRMLRIPALVRSGELLLIPHPMIPRWYVVL